MIIRYVFRGNKSERESFSSALLPFLSSVIHDYDYDDVFITVTATTTPIPADEVNCNYDVDDDDDDVLNQILNPGLMFILIFRSEGDV